MNGLSADPLAQRTDELTEAIAYTEKYLTALRLGTSAYVPLYTEDIDEGTLSFRKEGKEWRLLYDLPTGSQLLSNAPRHVRIQAASRLPALYDALLAARAGYLDSVRAARDAVRAFNETIKKKENV